jgi:hypothetical protein
MSEINGFLKSHIIRNKVCMPNFNHVLFYKQHSNCRTIKEKEMVYSPLRFRSDQLVDFHLFLFATSKQGVCNDIYPICYLQPQLQRPLVNQRLLGCVDPERRAQMPQVLLPLPLLIGPLSKLQTMDRLPGSGVQPEHGPLSLC